MICNDCGTSNIDTASNCIGCGNSRLFEHNHYKKAEGVSLKKTVQIIITDEVIDLKQMNVLLLFGLTVITVGIYTPFWYLKRTSAINTLKSNIKIEKKGFIIAIVLLSVSLLLSFVSGMYETYEIKDTAKTIEAFSKIIDLIAGLFLLIQSFKVKKILNDHFNLYLHKNIHFSGLTLFFFQIFYLQYKINRL